MNTPFRRRTFLHSLLAGPLLLGGAAARTASTPGLGKILDLHTHLFGTGDNDSGCRLSKEIRDGLLFKGLVGSLDLRRRAHTIDEAYVLALAENIETSGFDRVVVLSQDAVYDANGKPDWDRTPVYVPNDYLFKTVAKYSKKMIPCVSINPQRIDAIDELEKCVAHGARVLKIHAPIQGVDVSDMRYLPFFRRCADLNVIVMVHTGHENSAPIFRIQLADPYKLKNALNEGCTVVACHCGTGRASNMPDMLPHFLEMIRKHDNLWGDTAVLGSIGRSRDLMRLIDDELAVKRILHGSDFPFPSVPLEFSQQLGDVPAARLQFIGNPIKRDFELKVALKIGRESAARAYRLVCGGGE